MVSGADGSRHELARDLPRGPHSLTREEVAESQRRRLVEAMIDEVGTAGYAQTTVTDVIVSAGVSRKAFYEHFHNREECFLAAYDQLLATSVHDLDAACRSAPVEEARVESVVTTLFKSAVASPSAVRFTLTEIVAAGPEGAERRERRISSLEEILRRSLGLPASRRTSPDPMLRALVGGITEVLLTRASEGKLTQLRRVVRQVVEWISSYQPTPSGIGARVRNGHELTGSRLTGGRAPGSLTPAVSGRRRGLRGDNTSSRSFVMHNQRERILDAVASSSVSKGYAAVAVRDIAEEASVSLDAFYEHFAGKEDAFLCAYEVGHARSLAAVEGSFESAPDWPSGVHAAIAALFEFLVSEPIFARMALLQAPIATAQIAARARHGFLRYTSMLTPGLEEASNGGRVGPIAIEAIRGGLLELCLTFAVFRHEEVTQELVDLATFFTLAPFIGADEAGRMALPA